MMIHTNAVGQFQKRLLRWFERSGRHNLPWQLHKTPYAVLISEVMLQQTQVSTVIPYYERFMQAFPTVHALAEADFEHVQHLWNGLGYYRRAAYLHETAKTIVTQFNGQVPNCLESLQTLKGVGRSTAGAIVSSAYGKRGVILDGNVKRVLARVFGISDPINSSTHANQFWDLAEQLTPTKHVANYNQAMMDLGATVCKPTNPLCKTCPMQDTCHAAKHDCIETLPVKTASRAIPTKETIFMMLQHQNEVLLIKRKARGVWQNLWGFPEYSSSSTIQHKTIKKYVAEQFGLPVAGIEVFETIPHQFSHYRLRIQPLRITVRKGAITRKSKLAPNDAIWYNVKQPIKIGLPKPVAELLEKLAI